MPIPIPPPNLVETAPTPQPYYIREPQDWAIEQERRRHNQALYMVGEWAYFYLMWHQIDFDRGLVARCTRCYSGADARKAAVYNQPTKNKCPTCFGTTFEGGYRARIVRPTIFADVDEDEKADKKGSVHPAQISVETTSDFRIRAGDYVFRADGSRWQLGTPNRTTLRTGMEHPAQVETAISYNQMTAKYEERGTVPYLLPPTNQGQVKMILSQPLRYPGDFDVFEDIRADLIPDSIMD